MCIRDSSGHHATGALIDTAGAPRDGAPDRAPGRIVDAIGTSRDGARDRAAGRIVDAVGTPGDRAADGTPAVSYTHLTLPTIYPVQFLAVTGSLKI